VKGGAKITQDQLQGVLASINRLADNEVLVGVPSTKAARDDAEDTGSPITNAQIGYINEFGSPAQNIPPRPHLFSGVRVVRAEIVARLKKAARLGMSGNAGAVERAQHSIGLIAQNAVRAKITEGLSPALSPKTIYNRQNRKIAPRMGIMPLIDKGLYRRALTYVIRKREK
jgi:hypothetical protein